MEEVVLLTRTKMAAARIHPLLRLPKKGVARIRGDRALLEQAVLNLVLNAIEAMKEGGALRLQVRVASGKVILAVCDRGKGMGKDIAARLFEPFLSRRPGGTGLGLALVRRTVEAHGGVVRIFSKVGRGTRVEVQLAQAG